MRFEDKIWMKQQELDRNIKNKQMTDKHHKVGYLDF